MQRLIFLFLCLLPAFLMAQSLTADKAVLNFGDAYENQADSLALTLSNAQDHTVKVVEIRFYELYDSQDFWVKEDTFSLAPGGSRTLWVYFQPQHNITYNSEMLILNDGKRGAQSINLRGIGKYSNTAYNRTDNLSQQALKNELKQMTAENQVTLTYNFARDKMFMEIDNQKVNGQGTGTNTLECVYTGTTITGFNNRSAAQNLGFNTEHTYPQSMFNQNVPMRSDLHHLFPTTVSSNSKRASLAFGTVSNPSWQQGGSKQGNGVFEPRDAQKGLTARAMLYFVLRYQNYNNFLTGQESILRQWHQDFPPDAVEKQRNEAIETIQGNRNPFIDYPQLSKRISSISNTATEPVNWALDLGTNDIDLGLTPSLKEAIFTLPLVNHGNQAIQVSSLSLNDPALTFVGNTGDNTTIAPGEAHEIKIRLFASEQGMINASLSLQTNLPGQDNLNIPVKAEISGINDIKGNLPAWIRVYPVPALDTLWMEVDRPEKGFTWELRNLAGQKVRGGYLGADKQAVDLHDLSGGVYELRFSGKKGSWSRKVIVGA
jgi:deoxyribonuclease-1